jgi:hypothetical protein
MIDLPGADRPGHDRFGAMPMWVILSGHPYDGSNQQSNLAARTDPLSPRKILK